MILIPAIDLYQGRCVRLFQGDFEQVTYYNDEPDTLAKHFSIAGANWLHLVNLDGAESGTGFDYERLRYLCDSAGLKIQCGGGFRDQQSVQRALQIGVSRVVIGSMVLTDPITLKSCLHDYGPQRITLALDVRINNGEPLLASHGWKKQSNQSLWDTLDEFAMLNISDVLCTDISKDGAMSGPNVELYAQCTKRYPTIRFQASGGVRDYHDLVKLSDTGVAAAIVGRALYKNSRLLEEAQQFLPNA